MLRPSIALLVLMVASLGSACTPLTPDWEMPPGEPSQLAMLQNDRVATLLVSLRPFSEFDIDIVHAVSMQLGFNMLLTPRKLPTHPLLRELASQPTREAMWRWASGSWRGPTGPTGMPCRCPSRISPAPAVRPRRLFEYRAYDACGVEVVIHGRKEFCCGRFFRVGRGKG